MGRIFAGSRTPALGPLARITAPVFDLREDLTMHARVGAGLAYGNQGVDGFAEAAARAALGLGGGPCDLALVFAGAENLDHVEEGLAAVGDRLHPDALVGCGAQGVVGSGRELEEGGVAVWAASLPEAEVHPFHVQVGRAGDAVVVTGVPELDGVDAAILLADPYSFPAEPLLRQLSDARPYLPVIGGMASAGAGGASLLLGDEAVSGGAVGVVLTGADVRSCVSQGARPVGPEMTVTAGEGNLIEELASEPALERLQRAVAELGPDERHKAAHGLLVGVVADPNKPDYESGDFLVRGILGADEETGALTVGTQVRVGQTVRLQVRDAAAAHEDLIEALDREAAALEGPPAGALLFTCNGRGSQMFGTPDHDARVVDEAFSHAPTGGFFCAGEFGPVAGRNFVHGFTATLAVFP
jgi:small ligand-binding sensory domain FIST